MNKQSECKLAEGFSLWEKLYAQISFLVMGFAGTIGIILVDWRWIFPYLIIYWYGIPGIIMRHLVCPRCPHLHTYGDCLQFLPALTKRLIKQRKTTPLSKSERWLFRLIFILIPLYPIYWLLWQPVLLIIFILSASAWYIGQLFYFCKRCRIKSCPFNRVPVS